MIIQILNIVSMVLFIVGLFSTVSHRICVNEGFDIRKQRFFKISTWVCIALLFMIAVVRLNFGSELAQLSTFEQSVSDSEPPCPSSDECPFKLN